MLQMFYSIQKQAVHIIKFECKLKYTLLYGWFLTFHHSNIYVLKKNIAVFEIRQIVVKKTADFVEFRLVQTNFVYRTFAKII